MNDNNVEISAPPQTETDLSNIGNNYESFREALPKILKEIFSKEQPPMPTELPEQISLGQREVATYGLLLWCQENGRLPSNPKDPENEFLTIKFPKNPPKVKIGEEEVTVTEIRGVNDGQFICQIERQEGQKKLIDIPAENLLEAQRRIVEESSETGIIKASSLQAFLESQIIKKEGGESLTDKETEFNRKINQLLENIRGRLTVDQGTLKEIFQVVLGSNNPQVVEIQQRIAELNNQLQRTGISEEDQKQLQTAIETLNQLMNASQEQRNNDISTFVEKIYQGKFTLQEIDKINELLATGELGSIEDFLKEKDTDNDETRNAKRNAKKVVEAIRKYSPAVGGALGIILLLMILKASQQGNSGGSPLG